jgi:hypothetical protein
MGARPDGKRPAAAGIIANGGRTASHWAHRGFPAHFPPRTPLSGMKFAGGLVWPGFGSPVILRMPGKCQMNAANICLY